MSNKENVQAWRNSSKLLLAKSMGGACNKCGYDTCIEALDFHHLRDKEFTISKKLSHCKSIYDLVEECKKCVLLCCRCHRELHYNLWFLEDIKIREFSQELFENGYGKLHITCECGKNFKRVSKLSKYCCAGCRNKYTARNKNKILTITVKKERVKRIKKEQKSFLCTCGNTVCRKDIKCLMCFSLSRRKVLRPSKEELEKLVWSKPSTEIAKDYKVSDKSIGKWCEFYNIEKPPRGYWQKKENKK